MTDTPIDEEPKQWAEEDWKSNPKLKKSIDAGGVEFFSGTTEEEKPLILDLDEPPIPPWDIRLLDEQGWKQLEEWVEWLRGAYRLEDKILSCWWQHISVSMELAALKASWSAFYGPMADLERPTGPGEWHHYLDMTLSRIERHWKLGCSLKNHDEYSGPGPAQHRTQRTSNFNIAIEAFESASDKD